MENKKYNFWIDGFPVVIALFALVFSGISLCQSNASFTLSKKTAKPYLDIKLKKFSGNTGYYSLKRDNNGIQVSFRLEMENTGSVPITNVSISKFVFFDRNKSISQMVESSVERTVVYPGKSRFFVENITLKRFDVSEERAWELAQKEDFIFDIEFIVEYSNVFDGTIKTKSEMGYKFSKATAENTKNKLIE